MTKAFDCPTRAVQEAPKLRESHVEKLFVKAVKQAGGIAPKFTSPGMAGMPDRLVILPGRPTAYVELKAPGEKPRPIQLRRHQQLRALGCHVHVIDHPTQIHEVIHAIRTA